MLQSKIYLRLLRRRRPFLSGVAVELSPLAHVPIGDHGAFRMLVRGMRKLLVQMEWWARLFVGVVGVLQMRVEPLLRGCS